MAELEQHHHLSHLKHPSLPEPQPGLCRASNPPEVISLMKKMLKTLASHSMRHSSHNQQQWNMGRQQGQGYQRTCVATWISQKEFSEKKQEEVPVGATTSRDALLLWFCLTLGIIQTMFFNVQQLQICMHWCRTGTQQAAPAAASLSGNSWLNIH